MIRFDAATKTLRLAVGDLVRHGTPPGIRQGAALEARLAAGGLEHRIWQEERRSEGEGFRAEAAVEGRFRIDGHEVRLEGRIDGLTRDGDRFRVDEVKTVILGEEAWDAAALAAAVRAGEAWPDWRFQLEIYALLVTRHPPSDAAGGAADSPPRAPAAARLILRNLAVAAVAGYRIDVDRIDADRIDAGAAARQISIDIEPDLDDVDRRVRERLERILAEEHARAARARELAAAAAGLPFPHADYRPGQRDLEDAAREALLAGEHLLLSAPTGIGKTAAVLRAALEHALGSGRRVIWVTARNTQQRIVIETLERIVARLPAGGRPAPRAVVLRGRERMCPRLDEGLEIACDEAICRFARRFGPKLAASGLERALLALDVIRPEELRREAESHELCPYELALRLCPEADIVIGDYNHVFDPASALRRFAGMGIVEDAILVIDEAHNLPSRARDTWSAALSERTVEEFRAWARWRVGEDAEALAALADRAAGIFGDSDAVGADDAGGAHDARGAGAPPLASVDVETLGEMDAELALHEPRWRLAGARAGSVFDEPPLRFARDLRRLVDVLRLAADGMPAAAFVDDAGGGRELRAVCLDPSGPLGERIAGFRSAIALSATLEPMEYFRNVLGFPDRRTRLASFPSPFPAERRGVFIDPSFATVYRKRSADAARIASTADAIAACRRGNYLVFLSSHRYLEEVVAHVDGERIGRDVLVQSPRMSDAERERILDLLREPGSARILYGVLGGIFSEGVDYPGAMAIGVIVVGPGLPAPGIETDLVRRHFDETLGRGFEHAYLYPGMFRVLQAAGRIHRSAEDTGIIVLLGERFGERLYARLLPDDWHGGDPGSLIASDLESAVRAFWARHPADGGRLGS